MDNMNFDDILKKAMEAEMKDDSKDDEKEKDDEIGFKSFMGIVGMGSLIKLSKAANDRMVTVIKDLKKELSIVKEESTTGRVAIIRKIEETSKTINVLNTIIAAAAISGSATLGGSDSDEDIEKSLDIIIRFMLMR